MRLSVRPVSSSILLNISIPNSEMEVLIVSSVIAGLALRSRNPEGCSLFPNCFLYFFFLSSLSYIYGGES